MSVGRPKRAASSGGTLNRTQTEGDECSLYSTSASASAVSKGIDQYTGFLLRYTSPLSTNAAKTRRMSASKAGSLVLYSLAQSATTPRRLNWSLCLAIHVSEKASQSRRSSDVDTCLLASRSSRATFCSIGSPWQSQPGT